MSDCDCEEEEDMWEDYASGPYCRHWADICDIICALCGLRCTSHDDDACEWKDPE